VVTGSYVKPGDDSLQVDETESAAVSAPHRNEKGLTGGFGLAATSIGGFVLGLFVAMCATTHADSATAVEE
jgi:hypothetical protein